jgi:hypothetical protein
MLGANSATSTWPTRPEKKKKGTYYRVSNSKQQQGSVVYDHNAKSRRWGFGGAREGNVDEKMWRDTKVLS